MTNRLFGAALAAAMVVLVPSHAALSDGTAQPSVRGDRLGNLQREFEEYSGARLVFDRSDLPPGDYYAIMPALPESRKEKAAAICLGEVKKYPRGYLGKIGLKAFGVFAGCASKSSDGFRPYIAELGGYRYFGMWNPAGGCVGAYYSDEQLPLTFHHEIYHHVNGTFHGAPKGSQQAAEDDRRFRAATSGRQPYAPPRIPPSDLAALKAIARGRALEDAVSQYAAKSAGEDQAETARHFMTNLADSLVQIVERPSLPGSQRILHCLDQYNEASPSGLGVEHFVSLALGRAARATTIDQIVAQLKGLAYPGRSGWDGIEGRQTEAQAVLAAATKLDLSHQGAAARPLVELAAQVAELAVRCRLRAQGDAGGAFAVWGHEDAQGVNWTLRRDVEDFGAYARWLGQLAAAAPAGEEPVVRTQLKGLRLLACYYVYIQSNWQVTDGTRQVFRSTRDTIADSLPAAQAALASTIKETDLPALAVRIPVDGAPKLLETDAGRQPKSSSAPHDNPYLGKLSRAVSDPEVLAALRRVQPACVRVGSGSGCCISAEGVILTAGHVARRIGQRLTVEFPDGTRYEAACTALNEDLDVAAFQIKGVDRLPFASLAAGPPEAGDWVCVIGQPGTLTPSGSPTGYAPFHVSTGHVRGFRDKDRLASQRLGGAKHDAWTYWGHSGSPLFNRRGQIVAMHNSWDSTTAMRHAVTYEAIVRVLRDARVDFAIAPQR